MKQVKDDILIWESFSNPLQNQKYEFDGVDIESGNKKYTVYACFDYGNKQIGSKEGKRVMADIPIAIQPTFITYDTSTGQPVTDQSEKNNVAETILSMAQNDKKYHKNVTLQ